MLFSQSLIKLEMQLPQLFSECFQDLFPITNGKDVIVPVVQQCMRARQLLEEKCLLSLRRLLFTVWFLNSCSDQHPLERRRKKKKKELFS